MQTSASPHLFLAKELWKNFLQFSDIAIDATCGNGNDTLFLAGLCTVIGIDIQPVAIQSTADLLERHGKKALLQRLSHEHLDQLPLPHPPKLIVYNLGYLPRGDKTLTTKVETTLASVKKGLDLLAPAGALSITCYPGHEEGAKEEKKLLEWATQLGSDRYLVCHHTWLNRKGAPSLLWISAL